MSPRIDQPDAAVDTLLREWKTAIDQHDPEAVASLFGEDALFQGFRPTHVTGRPGVAEYYASQPQGMTVEYEVLNVRPLGAGAVVAYVAAAFRFVDSEVLPVHLTIIAEFVNGAWQISHYHVSRVH